MENYLGSLMLISLPAKLLKKIFGFTILLLLSLKWFSINNFYQVRAIRLLVCE